MSQLDVISEDAELLISKFIERGSLQYADFKEVWNELSFCSLYCLPKLCGDKRNYNLPITELIHKIFQAGARHMCCRIDQGESFLTQVAGLYVCYSVYITQPLDVKARIRLTLDDWEQLGKLQAELKKQKLLHALYILMALKRDSAFTICCKSSHLFLSYRNNDKPAKLWEGCLMPESSDFLTSVQKDIASVSKDYDELKETLSVCLPPHLLKQSDLPERIEKVASEYPRDQ